MKVKHTFAHGTAKQVAYAESRAREILGSASCVSCVLASKNRRAIAVRDDDGSWTKVRG